MAVGTRNAIYYREIDLPIDINHKVENYEYSAKWRIEFIPAGAFLDENPINVEYNEFPPFVFMINESGTIENECLDGIPYGLHKADEMTLTINLGSFIDNWYIVRNFITNETLNLGTSPATVKFNQWKIWRIKLDGTLELHFWGCQTGMGGYPEWGLGDVKTYEIKAMDVFRAITGKVTITQLIQDMIDNLTFTQTNDVYSIYSVDLSIGAIHSSFGSAYQSLTVRQIFTQLLNSLNARAKYPLTIDFDVFHFDYETPFITLYKQNSDGTTAKGDPIDLMDSYRIMFYANDGGVFDGLFYNEKGWQKYPTVWDLLDSTSKGLFTKLDYDYDQNNNVKMAFFNCMALLDYDRTVPANALIDIGSDFIASDKLKQRSKIFGASIAHYMAVNEKDLEQLVINTTNYTMISESQEEEMEFNTNKSFCSGLAGGSGTIYEFNTLPIFGLFSYHEADETDTRTYLHLLHDYCEIDCNYAATVKPNSEYDTYTNYNEIGSIDELKSYIFARQLKAGIGYVWALCNNYAFSGQNQAVIPMKQKILSADNFIKLSEKYQYDVNAKFGLSNFNQFKDQIYIIKKKLNLFTLINEIEILIRGDI